MKSMLRVWRRLPLASLLLVTFVVVGCGSTDPSQYDPKLELINALVDVPDPLASYTVTGNVAPVRDPSIMHVGDTYYVFTTDVGS